MASLLSKNRDQMAKKSKCGGSIVILIVIILKLVSHWAKSGEHDVSLAAFACGMACCQAFTPAFSSLFG